MNAASSGVRGPSSVVRTRPRGFTLIEMMVVVVAIGIIAALSAPLVGGWLAVTPGAAARTLVSDLLYAQNLAITTRSPVCVSFGPDAYTISAGGATVTNPVTGRPYVVNVGSGGTGPLAGVSINSLTLGNPINTVLAFDELGEPYAGVSTTTATTPLAAGGSVVLKGQSNPVTVWIEPGTGNLTVSE
jgi:prepilin-type N-terminal cleavage/methylation domain-containing protein